MTRWLDGITALGLSLVLIVTTAFLLAAQWTFLMAALAKAAPWTGFLHTFALTLWGFLALGVLAAAAGLLAILGGALHAIWEKQVFKR